MADIIRRTVLRIKPLGLYAGPSCK